MGAVFAAEEAEGQLGSAHHRGEDVLVEGESFGFCFV